MQKETKWVCCPKCKHETLISVEKFNITIIKELDAQTQSR
ncbi:cysteine-rich KTR domain-containing protein [Streptococcus gallolyticus]